jgi:lysophospholipase L1-like esterase
MVAAAQGIWLRATVKPAPPAGGPDRGTAAGGPPGRAGDPLTVVVLGDSCAAGCGVATHDEGFAGCLARSVAARTGRPVAWQAIGQYGATVTRIRHKLLPRVGSGVDLVVLLAGANDVLGRREPAVWSEDLTAILDGLADRTRHVAVVGIPPFALFPSIPTTLGRHLAKSAAALDEASRRICATRPATRWVGATAEPGHGFFAADRFHPSGDGYRMWAQTVADEFTVEDFG